MSLVHGREGALPSTGQHWEVAGMALGGTGGALPPLHSSPERKGWAWWQMSGCRSTLSSTCSWGLPPPAPFSHQQGPEAPALQQPQWGRDPHTVSRARYPCWGHCARVQGRDA